MVHHISEFVDLLKWPVYLNGTSVIIERLVELVQILVFQSDRCLHIHAQLVKKMQKDNTCLHFSSGDSLETSNWKAKDKLRLHP